MEFVIFLTKINAFMNGLTRVLAKPFNYINNNFNFQLPYYRTEYSEDNRIMYIKGDKTKKPYCPTCYALKRKLIIMQLNGKNLKCDSCHHYGKFEVEEYNGGRETYGEHSWMAR